MNKRLSSLLFISYVALIASGANFSFQVTSRPVSILLFSLAIILASYSLLTYAKTMRSQDRRMRAIKRHSLKVSHSARRFLIGRINDLRRPLQGLVGVSDLFSKGDSSLSETQDYFDISNSCSRFLIHQLERLQLYSELENQSIRFDARTFSLKKLIPHLVSQSKESLQLGSPHINVEWSDDCPDFVLGNPKAIGSLLQELLNNAVKFAGSGLITIKISTQEDDANKISICIRDSGDGLSISNAQIITTPKLVNQYSPFWPEAKSGLGLIIVNKLAAALSAKISVVSSKGKGTQYTIDFPTAALQPAAIKPIIRTSLAGEKLRVLVVDDDPITLQVVCHQLKSLGILAETASNGRECIQQQSRTPYDVIIMDLNMPILDGYESARIIKSADKNNQTAILALSINYNQVDIDRCHKLGFSDFLAKPADANELVRALVRLGHLPEYSTSNVISIDAARHRQSQNKFHSSGYYINFNSLFNSLGEDLTICHDILKQMSTELSCDLNHLSRSVEQNNFKESLAIIHKLEGELTLLHCPQGVATVLKMRAAVQSHDGLAIQNIFAETCQLFENILTEMSALIEKDAVA